MNKNRVIFERFPSFLKNAICILYIYPYIINIANGRLMIKYKSIKTARFIIINVQTVSVNLFIYTIAPQVDAITIYI